MMSGSDLTAVFQAMDQVKTGMRVVRAEVVQLRTDQTGLRDALAGLDRSVARLLRILDGDPTVRHKGLVKEFEELQADHVGLTGRVKAIEDNKVAEKNRVEGMRVILGAVGGASGISIIAQIFQFYQATKVP